MTSSIGSTSMGMFRPDPSQMASKLFSQLDTKNQGYLEVSDLQSAFDQMTGSTGSVSAEDVFARLDSDSDGKVTEDEMATTLKKLAEELDSQFNQMRMNGFGGTQGAGGMGGMPPPPPPGDDQGFTQEELSAQLEEIGDADSQRASLISSIVNNFDAADTDGDGKVSFKEAMAYDQSSQDSSSAGSTASTRSADSDAQVMRKIMDLMHAYGGFGSDSGQSALAGLLSVSA